jgi:hypothetical protein
MKYGRSYVNMGIKRKIRKRIWKMENKKKEEKAKIKIKWKMK